MNMLHPYEEIENVANIGSLYLYDEPCDKIINNASSIQFNNTDIIY